MDLREEAEKLKNTGLNKTKRTSAFTLTVWDFNRERFVFEIIYREGEKYSSKYTHKIRLCVLLLEN